MQDVKNAIEHLRSHQTYPATKQELVTACENLKDFSSEDKKWFEEHLPDKQYNSAQEVIDNLGWQKQATNMMENLKNSMQI